VLRQAAAQARGLPSTAPADMKFLTTGWYAACLTELGRLDEAERLLHELEREFATGDAPQFMHQAFVMRDLAIIEWRRGHIGLTDDQRARLDPIADRSHIFAACHFMRIATEVERAKGDRLAERTLLDRALRHADDGSLPLYRVEVLAQSVFGAWLAGEDDSWRTQAAELQLIVASDGFRALEHLVQCATGQARAPTGIELPETLAHAELIACGDSSSLDAAQAHAAAAVAAAQEFGSPFILALANLALAESKPEERATAHAQAQSSAASVESQRFQAAVSAVVSGGDAGMLAGFISRLRRPIEMREGGKLRVAFLAGTVARGSDILRVAGRELELLCAIARQRRPTPQEELEAMLWPDADSQSASNSFKVCMHRLRKQVGDERVVVRSAQGYRVGDHVRVDIWELEDDAAPLRASGKPGRADIDRLRRSLDRLQIGRAELLKRWAWSDSLDRRIDELRHDLTLWLGREALERGDFAKSLAHAAQLVEYDSYDESGRELAIRAYLGAHDHAAAVREYREYRDVLVKDLGVEPSTDLKRLLEVDAKTVAAGPTLRP